MNTPPVTTDHVVGVGVDLLAEALVAAGAEVHLSNAGATRRALEILGGAS